MNGFAQILIWFQYKKSWNGSHEAVFYFVMLQPQSKIQANLNILEHMKFQTNKSSEKAELQKCLIIFNSELVLNCIF